MTMVVAICSMDASVHFPANEPGSVHIEQRMLTIVVVYIFDRGAVIG
jgi:hypothetical protein